MGKRFYYLFPFFKKLHLLVEHSKYNLEQFLIPIPPLAEQKRIVQKLDELMQYCNELEVSIQQSESQNEKLLQQVLREALRPAQKNTNKKSAAV
jgi:hypothetical protein